MPEATTNSKLLVRVQARGGKFLADDMGGAEVTVRDAHTGERLGGGLVQGTDSGTFASAYSAAASQLAVVTPGPQPNVQWLTTGPQTSKLMLDLALRRPTLLDVTARGPVGGLQSIQQVTTSTWALPGSNLEQGPGLVVELPGLVVDVLSPATHQQVLQFPARIELTAKVMMMCGCQIADGGIWIPGDFVVSAAVSAVGSGQPATVVPLFYQGGNTSVFAGLYTMSGPGYFQAVISAVQQSIGNVGTATVTFYAS
jgi:hypothetical protein